MFRLALLTVFSALATFAQVADRPASISELVRSNPGAALRQLASEEPQLFQGSLRSLTFDNPETGELETRTTLQVGEATYSVYSEGQTQTGCMELANVRGYRVDGQILAASIENAGPLNSPVCTSIGEQKTLVLLIQTPTLTALPSKAFVQGFMTGVTPPTVDGYFREMSNGQTWVTADVAGPFTMADAAYGCASTQDPVTGQPTVLLAAMAAAGGSVDFTLYSRIILIAPVAPTPATPPGALPCSTRVYSNTCVALTAPGNVPIIASWGYIASNILPTSSNGGGVNLASKVLVNGMGAGWSYTRDFGSVAIGPFGPGGTDTLNGDHSIMGDFQSFGGVFPLGHVVARQKVDLGWYASGVNFINVQTNNVSTILPASSPTAGVKALRIRRGTGFNEWLWVEHRQFIGPYDSTLQQYAPNLATGVLIHHERPTDTRANSYLLDFNPVAAPNDFKTAMLTPGAQWDDPSSNLSLQVAAVASGMQVTTTYRSSGGCVYVPSQSTFNVSGAAGSAGFSLTTGTFCEWAATTSLPFITITSSTLGTGSASLTFNYAVNATGSPRTATLDISGQPVTVNQAGGFLISGTTTLAGTALPGVTITATGSASQTTTTDASGNYLLGGYAGGSATVTPTLSGYSFTPPSVTFPSVSSNQVANFVATRLPATMSLDRTRLNYAARNTTLLTPPQKVVVSFGGGTASWTAASNQPWLQVTPASGSGPTRLTVSLVPGSMPASGVSTATVTITAPSATPTTVTLSVFLTRLANSSASFGVFDTPTNNATNVTGSISVSGWALDDIFVSKVQIWRDPIAGEPVHPNGFVYIGDAIFVPNARPDVEGIYPTLPFSYQGGWGYLMLTNGIPNAGGPLGNGTIKLWAIATDIEGNNTILGSKTITMNNAHSVKPFGAIDNPGPGGSAVGTYVNSGWVMTPPPNIFSVTPTTIFVNIDGADIGRVTYGQARSDVAAYFAAGGFRNITGPGGFFSFDSTLYANRMHTISWNAYDDVGNADGIGSRYFFVENGVSAGIANLPPPVAADMPDTMTALRSARPRPQRGAVPQVMTAQELERLVIALPEGQWTGAHVINGDLQPLPVGSTLDNARGAFYWQLGPGFLGRHELLFTSADGAVHGVTVNIEPKSFGERQ